MNGKLQEKVMSDDEIYAVIEDQKLGVNLLSKVYGIPKDVLMNHLRRAIEKSKLFQEENWYGQQKLYWSKIDAWAIGMVLLTLFVDLTSDPTFSNTDEQRKKAPTALRVIRGLCNLDPAQRLDAAEGLQIWAPNSPILQLPAVQQWLEAQKKMRSEMSA